jgi:hypothetical protein
METVIEGVRLLTGLGQMQMLRAIGAKPHQKSLLTGKLDPPPAFMRAAADVIEAYITWRKAVLDSCQHNTTYSSIAIAELFGINYQRLYMWIRHGDLKPRERGTDGLLFDYDSLVGLFNRNETALRSHNGTRRQPRRGPLGSVFFDHLSQTPV